MFMSQIFEAITLNKYKNSKNPFKRLYYKFKVHKIKANIIKNIMAGSIFDILLDYANLKVLGFDTNNEYIRILLMDQMFYVYINYNNTNYILECTYKNIDINFTNYDGSRYIGTINRYYDDDPKTMERNVVLHNLNILVRQLVADVVDSLNL